MATRSTPAADPDAPEVEMDQVTSAADLGFVPREIEVEPVKVAPPQEGPDGTVVIRMAETIEEFTYGNPHVSFKLEAGKIYRVPAGIARYLHSLGKIYTN